MRGRTRFRPWHREEQTESKLPTLKSYLKPLAGDLADELHIYSGVRPTYLKGRDVVKEIPQTLGAEEIRSLLTEILDDKAQADLVGRKPVDRQYKSPGLGVVRVQVKWSDSGVKCRFTMRGGDTEELTSRSEGGLTPADPNLRRSAGPSSRPGSKGPGRGTWDASQDSMPASANGSPRGVDLSPQAGFADHVDSASGIELPSLGSMNLEAVAEASVPILEGGGRSTQAPNQPNLGSTGPTLSPKSPVSYDYDGTATNLRKPSREDQVAITSATLAAITEQRTTKSPQKKEIDQLFRIVLQQGASDLHLSTGEKPMIRVDGTMKKLDQLPILTQQQVIKLLAPIIPERNRKEFTEDMDTDFGYEIPDTARFRCNVFMDRKGVCAVFRYIPSDVLTVEQLGLSKAISNLCYLTKGLVLVTGPTGSGKSTTLCAMVDLINRKRTDHVITIEDPIEFVHPNKQCLVNQREVITHTKGFKAALRAALREDPDVVLVGELRDLETMSIAIETAETGHLVFGTLHTTTACSTVDRLIDQFPADRQNQIRMMLSSSLKGVISQTLLKKQGGGRVAAMEILLVTHGVANLIREGKTFQIPSIMQTARGMGMQTLNDVLLDLLRKKKVDVKEAYMKAPDKAEFADLLEKGGFNTQFLDKVGDDAMA